MSRDNHPTNHRSLLPSGFRLPTEPVDDAWLRELFYAELDAPLLNGFFKMHRSNIPIIFRVGVTPPISAYAISVSGQTESEGYTRYFPEHRNGVFVLNQPYLLRTGKWEATHVFTTLSRMCLTLFVDCIRRASDHVHHSIFVNRWVSRHRKRGKKG